ncbi:hypothetical protein SMD44_07345 [Streptomyces alboflavus]|uniref:Uncharacterized protein n=1 Tax=Streptomyces alboflavus TaxID=67267 RepID=A0A1Z1WN70_9ACTN|nr:hypothetical protein SMD44_07345 [Streptomyces alboflavus]
MILLMGRWNSGGNLIIESSDDFPDQRAEEDVDALVDEQDDSDCMAWAATFSVGSHKTACQEAYETYVKDAGGRLIDEVWGILVDE